jgi:proline iminopeptidase
MDFFVNDLEAIRRDLGVDKINLLGHSWGALLAVNYGIKYPDKVNKLILCNSVPLNRAYDQEMAKLQGSRMTGADSTDRSIIMGSKGFRDGKTEAYRKLLLLSFRHSFHKPHHYKKLKVVLPGNYPQSSKALFTGLGPDLKDYDYYNEIGSLKFPVLVLHGEQDIIPMEAITKIQKQIPATDVVVFNKSGHFLFIEENRKFTSEVTRFLKD